MACIRIKSAAGDVLTIPEGKSYPQGWTFTGEVVWDCAGKVQSDEVDVQLERAGIGLGDAIAWVTHKFGIQQCAPCKARQEILNNVKKVGWVETLRQIKDTF